jgi:hypothetical protein
MFNDSVTSLVTFFIEDNGAAAVSVIATIVRHFSTASVAVRRCMVGHVSAAIGQAPVKALAPCACALARMLGAAAESHAEQLGIAALSVWGRNGAIRFLNEYRKVVVPIVVPAVCRTAAGHWSPAVQEAARKVVHTLQRNEPRLVQQFLKPGAAGERAVVSSQRWREVTHAARERDRGINLAKKVGEIAEAFPVSVEKSGAQGEGTKFPRCASSMMRTLPPLLDFVG